MGVRQSIQAISVSHPFSMNKKLDQYLSERLPDLMDEYKLADRSDIDDIDKTLEGLEGKMLDLESWKKAFGERMDRDRHRVDRLKHKYGVK